MLEWTTANRHEQKMMKTMNIIFDGNRKLSDFLFESDRPKLRQEPKELLAAARGFSSGEQLMIRVGIDLWNGECEIRSMAPGQFGSIPPGRFGWKAPA